MAPAAKTLIVDDVFILGVQCVVFPNDRVMVPVSHDTFGKLRAHCANKQSSIGICAIKRQDPRGNELYMSGTYARLLGKSSKDKNMSISLSVEGRHRLRILEWKNNECTVAKIELIAEPSPGDSVHVKALCTTVQDYLTQLIDQSSAQAIFGIIRQVGLQRSLASGRWSNNPGGLADLIGIVIGQLSLHERQQILDTVDVEKRLELACDFLSRINESNRIAREIQQKFHQRNEDELKEQVLRRQLTEVQRELRKLRSGSNDPVDDSLEDEDELGALRAKLDKAEMSEQAQKVARNEMKRLQTIQPHHPEYNVCRTYLETLVSLPWNISTSDTSDLKHAENILNEDHFGLEAVKKRVLQFLAVRQLRQDMKGPILCLHGPPGVGKTSLGKSIARALGRKFHRLALGGVRDEAEIRGHRRTYIGAMPGVFIQCMQQVGANNPVVLLDEVDKLAHNSMYNPQGALLEILDCEQNHAFRDHYLGVAFDLSNIFFIATCNEYDTIDRPLLDRMEIIEIAGYTLMEKKFIALNHLLPKQLTMHALNADVALLKFADDAMEHLISRWTYESGVRGLERRIAEVCRWAAQQVVTNAPRDQSDPVGEDAVKNTIRTPNMTPICVTKDMLRQICGIELMDHSVAERLTVGVSMGLAVTTVGGQLLFIESCYVPGERNEAPLVVTGQLGAVMKESVSAALSLLKSRRLELKYDIHVHFPSGAVPKDGPSAGVATTLALLSLILDEPLRSDSACTGEITLTGNVLPVGGVKEKIIAAHRAGIRYVLVPEKNRRNVEMDLPASLLSDITIVYLNNIDDATQHFYGAALSDALSVTAPHGPNANSDSMVTKPGFGATWACNSLPASRL